MRVEDQYPSTFDCGLPRIAGGQNDPVLECLVRARARIVEGHSRDEYISDDVNADGVIEVCAMGAIYADPKSGAPMDVVVRADQVGDDLYERIEAELSDSAKTAIRLLNEAALSRHSEAADYGQWSGPLEWVNQSWRPNEATNCDRLARLVKAEILAIYDLAIERRSGSAELVGTPE